MYKEALQIAYKAHNGQCRQDSNTPYIVHPIRVSGYFPDDFRKTIAVLHDVVEDTDITLDDLKKVFPYSIIDIVDLLTRRSDENYFTYIKRLSVSEVAKEIKIIDVVDNLSDTISGQPKGMINRYNKTLKLLTKVKL